MLLCDFHREQAWECWTSKKDKGVADNRGNILALMRQLARARTEDLYENALRKLKDTCEWKTNTKFKRWMENTWLRHKKVKKEQLILYYHMNAQSILKSVQLCSNDYYLKHGCCRTKF